MRKYSLNVDVEHAETFALANTISEVICFSYEYAIICVFMLSRGAFELGGIITKLKYSYPLAILPPCLFLHWNNILCIVSSGDK